MVDPSPQEPPEEKGRSNEPPNAGGMLELRALLLGKDREVMERLREWLDDPQRRAEEISQILPDSITLRTRRDKKLTRALTPTVEDALTISVKKNPRTIADAIFPIIGPAIRKAIASAFRELVQSLNQALEYSLSIRGLKWRLEALRTGKSFAEVVLSHTLRFRVEQVFLIHRETGLLLYHVAVLGPGVGAAKDADMVSGMLTAIQDFVRDSFGSKASDALEALEVGDLEVWFEQGPKALLAAVIRGDAPHEFRTVLQEAIEMIHLQQSEALDSFHGDTAAFEASLPTLEACLQTHLETREKKTSPLLWVATAAVLLALGVWLFFVTRNNWRWQDYLTRLKAEPGLLVVAQEKSGGKYRVTGLRDPLAADPLAILQTTPLDPADVVSRWESFYSSHADFVLQRANQVLQPPANLRLSFADGVLSAEGLASQNWIVEARRLTPMISGVTQFREDRVVSAEQVTQEIAATRGRIETLIVRFDVGSAEIVAEQRPAVEALATTIRRLEMLASAVNKKVVIEISGHTDKSGSERLNLKLEEERARNVLSALTAAGNNANNLSVTNPYEPNSRTREFDRKVTFKVQVAP